MLDTLQLAKKHGVKAGAHPSFPDRENFGRTEMYVPHDVVFGMVVQQIRALEGMAARVGIALFHVKPHGALYNMAAKDRGLAEAIAAAVKSADPRYRLVGLAGSALIDAGTAAGLRTAQEVFADRTYQDDGSLTPRRRPDALITDEKKAVSQVLEMVQHRRVITVSGKQLPVAADTVCIHGDGADPAGFAKALRAALKAEGQKRQL